MSKKEDKKLKGIEYEQDFLGDSSKLYGEEFLKDKEGELVIDPITNKPVAASFMETHGDRIFGALEDALTQKADDPEETKREYEQLLEKDKDYAEYLKDLDGRVTEFRGTPEEVVDKFHKTMVNEHANNEFESQEDTLKEDIKKEEEEYKQYFEELTEKIAEQEKILTEVTEKFNTCQDKEEKIKLYHQVHEEMNKLIEVSSNYGAAVQNSDTNEVIDALSSYDNNYDEDATRKYIKDL